MANLIFSQGARRRKPAQPTPPLVTLLPTPLTGLADGPHVISEDHSTHVIDLDDQLNGVAHDPRPTTVDTAAFVAAPRLEQDLA